MICSRNRGSWGVVFSSWSKAHFLDLEPVLGRFVGEAVPGTGPGIEGIWKGLGIYKMSGFGLPSPNEKNTGVSEENILVAFESLW